MKDQRNAEEVSARIAEIRVRMAQNSTKANRISSGLVSRNIKPIPAPHKEHQRDMGQLGGLVKSPAKAQASRANLAFAREKLRWIGRPDRKYKTSAERQAAYRLRKSSGLGSSPTHEPTQESAS